MRKNKTIMWCTYVLMIILIYLCSIVSVFAAAIQLTGTDSVLEIRGAESGDYFGRPILCADINNDGYEDLFICSDRWTFGAGQRPTLYVFKGGTRYQSDGQIDLSSQSADAIILGDTGSDNFATAFATGDVNNDGIPDLVAADSTLTVSGRSQAGAVFVIFGSPTFFETPIHDLATGAWDVKILGAAAYDDTGGYNAFGGLTSKGLACGDINNDGIDDIAIGAHLATANSRTTAGKVFLVWGRTNFPHNTTIDLASQASSVILGNEQYGELGTAIAIGDLNADSIDDLIMGMEYGSKGTLTTEGKVFILWGNSSFPSTFNLLTQAANLTILGDKQWDQLGSAVTVADFNADGKNDLLVSAPGWDHTGSISIDEGAIYGFHGKTSYPSTINLTTTTADLFVEGYNIDNNIGENLEAGDCNGDGIGDFMFATRDGERPGFNAEGRTFLALGNATFPSHRSVQSEDADYIINGGFDYFQLGEDVALGDLDGDNADEIIISSPFVDSGTGRALIFDLNPVTATLPVWIIYE